MIYALFAAALCLVFAYQTGNDYRSRKKPYQAIWTVALLMAAVGSLGYAAAAQWASELGFRFYYVFGALAVAPVMGMGSIYLAMPRKVADRIMGVVAALLVIGAALLFTAQIDSAALAALSGGSGQGVLVRGSWLVPLIVLNFFGTAAVVGIAVFSAWRAAKRQSDRGFMWGNLVIGLGFFTLAMAGSVARWFPSWDGGFWAAQAVGWLIAYIGFRVVTKAGEARRSRSPAAAQQTSR